ncbi:glycosyltransferase family 8 protein [Octadecabacter ascidiaceicola]|uniref:General stress protein A n=1 Tax=Octadecabacter ascidiaceicola TaxID=1655543 RepID=A0A238KRI2_9RHOB|nr:glycosyltransferase family 8 protein [Octadecabacter ascidiaceicola]SMX45287.1 General stress protein A [Octadecabacter ascidiaceicola]
MFRNCITLVCNIGYIDKAAFVAHQLLAQTDRNFDVVICTDDISTDQSRNVPKDAILRQIDIEETIVNLPQNERLKHYTYWRLPAIQSLSDDYDRILYLDTDIFVVGDGISALFDIDMQGLGIAAVRDIHQRHRPNRKVQEFATLGMLNAPYFNAGVLLIDAAMWRKTSAFDYILKLAKQSPDALLCHDQSLLNIHFYQNWLELSPLWNWQNSSRVNLIGEFLSPYFVHFVGATKPWNSPDGSLPLKYHSDFARYFDQSPPPTQRPKLHAKFLLKNFWYFRRTQKYLARFSDPLSTVKHVKGNISPMMGENREVNSP